jgi:hypothetical protein
MQRVTKWSGAAHCFSLIGTMKNAYSRVPARLFFFCYLQESRTVRRTSVAQSTLDFLHPGSTLSPPRYIFPDENCCDDVGQMMFEP